MGLENSVFVTGKGHQNCADLHSWGPGVRQNYMLHQIIRGSGYLETAGKKFRIEAGESFLTFPGRIIHYYPEETDPWEYQWVDFIGENIPALLDRTDFSEKHPVCRVQLSESGGWYLRQLSQMDIYDSNRLEATGILLALLGYYADVYPARQLQSHEKNEDRLANALLLIQTHYHKADFHVSALCGMMNIGRVTLYRLFEHTLFCSPNEYLLRYRLDQSRKLLAQGFSVKQTAISCGFSDPYYFSRVFSKYEHETPSHYKEENQHRQEQCSKIFSLNK